MKASMSGRSSSGSVDSSGARRSLLASAPVGRLTVRTCRGGDAWMLKGKMGGLQAGSCAVQQQAFQQASQRRWQWRRRQQRWQN
jgi:hypothetical protein